MIHYKYQGSCNWFTLFYRFITILVVVFEHCNSSTSSFCIMANNADTSTGTDSIYSSNFVCIGPSDVNRSSLDSSCVGETSADNDLNNNNNSNNTDNTNKISRILLTSSGLVTKSMKLIAKKMYQESLKTMQQQQEQPIILYIVDAALEPIQYNFNDNNYNNTSEKRRIPKQKQKQQSRIVQQMERSMQREWDEIVGTTIASTNTKDIVIPKIIGIELATIQDNHAAHEIDINNNNIIGIYLEQGNTYYLLYQLRRTKFDNVIQDLLNNNGLFIVGASAGSIVCGSTIQTCEIKNWDDPGHNTFWDCTKQVTKLQGLNLLHETSLVGTSVFPHYSTQWDTRLQQMQQYFPDGIIVLNEEQYYIQGITTPTNTTELRGRIEH